MIEINQNKLCNFCEKEFNTDSNTCNWDYCQEAKNKYLEEYEIKIKENLSFKDLKIGNNIYILDFCFCIPQIDIQKIRTLSINSEKDSFSITTDSCNSNYKIEKEFMNKNKYQRGENSYIFLNEKDCNEKLKKVCTQRIIELSKIIGNTKEELLNKKFKELDFYYIKEIKTDIYEKCYAKDEQDPDSDKVSILDDGITFYNNSGNDHRIFIPFSDILLKK